MLNSVILDSIYPPFRHLANVYTISAAPQGSSKLHIVNLESLESAKYGPLVFDSIFLSVSVLDFQHTSGSVVKASE